MSASPSQDEFVAPPPPVGSDAPFYALFAVVGATYVVLILAMLLADAVYAFTTETIVPDRLDFEAVDGKTPIESGVETGDQFHRFGLRITAEPTECRTIIFNAEDPPAGFESLRAPSGRRVGNVVAAAEPGTPPRALATPHTLVFHWDEPVKIDDVQLLDVNEPDSEIAAFNAAGTKLLTVAVPESAEGGLQTVTLGVSEVSRLEMRFRGSAAVVELRLTWLGFVRSEWERRHPVISRLVHNQIVAAFHKPEIRYSIRLSLLSCTLTTILSLWVAIPIGYLMSRYEFFGRNLIDAILDIPIVLPPLVVGLSLLILFQYFPRPIREAVVFQIPAVILAQFAVSCAFAVRTMRATFDQIDARREQVALTLGCSRSQAFGLVVLPEAKRGVLTAATLAWARALGEFGPLLVFAGATRNKTEVLSTTVYLELNVGNLGAAVAVSLIMVIAAVIVLVLARLWGTRTLTL